MVKIARCLSRLPGQFCTLINKTARRDVLEVIEVLIDHGRRALAENDLILLSRTVTDLDRDLQRFGDIAAQYSNHHDIRSFREALV